MKVAYNNYVSKTGFGNLQLTKARQTSGQIIHFTGKPTSSEVSEVLRIANKYPKKVLWVY